jgi:hypothetical protein
VLIPEGTPAGMYTIETGLYDFNGTRLPVDAGGDSLVAASVEVQRVK